MTGGVDNRSDTAGMDADLITPPPAPPLLLTPSGTLSNWPAGRRCTTRTSRGQNTHTHTHTHTRAMMLIFLCIFTSEEFEEGEGDAEEEATHASFLSEGKTAASLTLSFPSVHIYCHPPRRTFLVNCFSKLLMITFGGTRPLCSVQNTRNNFPAVGLLLLDDSLGSDVSCRRFICLHFHRSE